MHEPEKCWLEVKKAVRDEQIRIELTGISYIDENGCRLLKSMFSEGAKLRATGVMTKGIIEEIASGTDRSNASQGDGDGGT